MLDAATLTALRARAQANTPQWQALKPYCDSFIGGVVNYPDGATYPNAPDIGQGYEGDGYWAPLMSEGLCYQVMRGINATAAAPYGAKAADIAVKISVLFPATGHDQPKSSVTISRNTRSRSPKSAAPVRSSPDWHAKD